MSFNKMLNASDVITSAVVDIVFRREVGSCSARFVPQPLLPRVLDGVAMRRLCCGDSGLRMYNERSCGEKDERKQIDCVEMEPGGTRMTTSSCQRSRKLVEEQC